MPLYLDDALVFLGMASKGYGGNYGPFNGCIDVFHPFFGAAGDCEVGLDGVLSGGNTLTLTDFSPPQYFVGKSLWSANFGTTPRTITAIAGKAISFNGGAVADGTGVAWQMGTDDTAALRKAMLYARYTPDSTFDLSGNLLTGGFAGAPTQNYRGYAPGRVVRLRSGHAHMLLNSAAAWDGGLHTGLTISRRIGLVGEGHMQSRLVLNQNHRGHAIMSENAEAITSPAVYPDNAYTDFVTLRDFGIACLKGYAGADATRDGSGIHIATSFNGYLDTDCHYDLDNIYCEESRKNSFDISGRGEFLMHKLRGHEPRGIGLRTYRLVDSSISQSTFGGSGKSGVSVESCANLRFVDVKSWYTGSLGTSAADCAGFYMTADQRLNGKNMFIGCETQETRGSGILISGCGDAIFAGCRVQDPGQLIGALGTRPAICAGVELQGTGASQINFGDLRVEAAVRAFNSPNFGGTHALYVGAGSAGNVGRIETQADLNYGDRSSQVAGLGAGAKIGGAGATTSANPRLLVDGAQLG